MKDDVKDSVESTRESNRETLARAMGVGIEHNWQDGPPDPFKYCTYAMGVGIEHNWQDGPPDPFKYCTYCQKVSKGPFTGLCDFPDPYTNDADFGGTMRWWLEGDTQAAIEIRKKRSGRYEVVVWRKRCGDCALKEADDYRAAICDAICELLGADDE